MDLYFTHDETASGFGQGQGPRDYAAMVHFWWEMRQEE